MDIHTALFGLLVGAICFIVTSIAKPDHPKRWRHLAHRLECTLIMTGTGILGGIFFVDPPHTVTMLELWLYRVVLWLVPAIIFLPFALFVDYLRYRMGQRK
jgi:hypothetical protein